MRNQKKTKSTQTEGTLQIISGERNDQDQDRLTGWHYLVVVLNWHTKEIISYHLSFQFKSKDWVIYFRKDYRRSFHKRNQGCLEKASLSGQL